MNTYLTHVEKRSKLSRLILNVKKTKCILLHRKQKPVPQHTFSISMGAKNIVMVDDTPFLGVFIKNHKISRVGPLVYRTKLCLSIYFLKRLNISLIYPNFIYCVTVRAKSPNSTLQPLFLLQKRVVKLMCNAESEEALQSLVDNLELFKLVNFRIASDYLKLQVVEHFETMWFHQLV